jgi:hypothetical protein
MTFQPPSNPQVQPASNHLPTPFQPPSNPCSFQPLIPLGLEPPLGAGFPQANDGRGGMQMSKTPGPGTGVWGFLVIFGQKKSLHLNSPGETVCKLGPLRYIRGVASPSRREALRPSPLRAGQRIPRPGIARSLPCLTAAS